MFLLNIFLNTREKITQISTCRVELAFQRIVGKKMLPTLSFKNQFDSYRNLNVFYSFKSLDVEEYF